MSEEKVYIAKKSELDKNTKEIEKLSKLATQTSNGLMDSKDKTKLDGIENGANKYIHPSGTNPHGTTKADIGLGNVGNFKAVSTVSSQGLTDTEKSNARNNIGLGNAVTYKALAVTSQSLSDAEKKTTRENIGLGNVGNYKSVSTISQNLSDTEKKTARNNIGLGNVGNYKSVSTSPSQGLTENEKKNARENIGVGTSTFSGNYKDLSNKPSIVDNLTTTTKGSILDASQGKVLNDAINSLKKSVSDGKTSVADAITGKGVYTATDASFDTLSYNVSLLADLKYDEGVSDADERENKDSVSYRNGFANGKQSKTAYINGNLQPFTKMELTSVDTDKLVSLLDNINSIPLLLQLKDLPYNLKKSSVVAQPSSIHILGGEGFAQTHRIYDIYGQRWSYGASLPYNFYNGAAIMIGDELHVFGGDVQPRTHYKLQNGTWTHLNDAPVDIKGAKIIAVNSTVYIITEASPTIIYTWTNDSWSLIDNEFDLSGAVLCPYTNNQFLIISPVGAPNDIYNVHFGVMTLFESGLPFIATNGSAFYRDGKVHVLGSAESGYTNKYWMRKGKNDWETKIISPNITSPNIAVCENEVYIVGSTGNSKIFALFDLMGGIKTRYSSDLKKLYTVLYKLVMYS